MIDQSPRNPNRYKDVIDLRELIKIVLNCKWIILGVTVIAALGSFLTSAFILSPQYEASAYVMFTEPIFSVEFESSIEISRSIPDSRTLSDLAESDSIVNSVIDELNLNDDLKDCPPELDAVLQGNSQLELIVKHCNPGITAEFANAWASIIVKRLNALYGSSEETISTLEIEVLLAREQWNKSQKALELFLPRSWVEVYEVNLDSAKSTLFHYQDKIYQRQILISDALTMLRQLDEENLNNPLSTSQALSMIAIQQRISGGMMDPQFQFQFQGEEILGSGYSVINGRESLINLIKAVEGQIKEFRDEIAVVEQRILDTAVELESEKFKIDGLTQERDIARKTYFALANQLEEIQITQAQDENSVKIAALAVIPQNPRKPSVPINTILAAIAGFIFSITWVLFYDWWNQEVE